MGQFIEAAAGGALIGAAAAGLLLLQGRIAGISGILGGVLRGSPDGWRWAFLAGLVLTGLAARVAGLDPAPALASEGWLTLGAAGLLVGIGTRIGSGCTSGHGVCGLANLSPRSAVAVAVFMAVAGLTVFVLRHGPGSS